MTNREILSTYEGLQSLKNRSEMRFPAKVVFAIARNMRILTPIIEDMQSARLEIISRYGEPSKDSPGMYVIPEANVEQAQKELSNLESVENNINFHKLKIEDLESMELSIQDMESLYPMLEEG